MATDIPPQPMQGPTGGGSNGGIGRPSNGYGMGSNGGVNSSTGSNIPPITITTAASLPPQQQQIPPIHHQSSSSISGGMTNCLDQDISTTRIRISASSQLYLVTKTKSDNTKEFIIEDASVGSWGMNGVRGYLLISIVGVMIILGFLKLSLVFVILWFWGHISAVKEESLLVVRDLGIQLKTTYNTGRSESKFIDKGRILELIINEGITMFQVKFYLAVLVEGEDKMSVVFEHFLPRLNVLLPVYKDTRMLMFKEVLD